MQGVTIMSITVSPDEYARLLFGIGLMERGRIYWQFFTIAGELEWWKRGKI
jgi:hypothetical protein